MGAPARQLGERGQRVQERDVSPPPPPPPFLPEALSSELPRFFIKELSLKPSAHRGRRASGKEEKDLTPPAPSTLLLLMVSLSPSFHPPGHFLFISFDIQGSDVFSSSFNSSSPLPSSPVVLLQPGSRPSGRLRPSPARVLMGFYGSQMLLLHLVLAE